MPVACSKCEELFDMAYDMENTSGNEVDLTISPKNKNKTLCWECRK
jgi:hypothetical protein